MTAVGDEPALAAIRRLCGPAHDELERSLGTFGWLADRARYVAALERFAGLHAALDARLLAAADALPGFDVAGACRLPLLEADLAALGRPPGHAAAVPRPPLDEHAGPEAALGALYVTEGAALGGKVIRREVRRRLGPDAPTAFFGVHGADAARRWRAFTARLDATVTGAEAIGEVARAARATMGLYEGWLAPLR